MKAEGTCHVTGMQQRHEGDKNAVFVRVLVRDEKGNRFYFDASCFNFDLVAEEEPKRSDQWRN